MRKDPPCNVNDRVVLELCPFVFPRYTTFSSLANNIKWIPGI